MKTFLSALALLLGFATTTQAQYTGLDNYHINSVYWGEQSFVDTCILEPGGIAYSYSSNLFYRNGNAVPLEVDDSLQWVDAQITGEMMMLLTLNDRDSMLLDSVSALRASVQNITLLPGPTGPTGPQGATGSQGPIGPQGSQGLSGVANATAPITYTAGTQTVGITAATTSAAGSMSAADKTKLDAFPTYNARTSTSATRSFNTAFQPSTTTWTRVNYSVLVTSSATLLGGQEGSVILEKASNSSFTSNVMELGRLTGGNSVSLAIAITAVDKAGGQLSGDVEPSYYVRLRTVNTTGTPTFTYVSGVEGVLP